MAKVKRNMTQAEQLLANPTADLRKLWDELKRVSASSASESRSDLEFEDGSVLVVTSRDGGECQHEVVAPPPEDPGVV